MNTRTAELTASGQTNYEAGLRAAFRYLQKLIISHIWMFCVTHMDVSCHTYECVVSHIWMCHVTHECVVSHTWVSLTHMDVSITHMGVSCGTHGCVVSHMPTSHGTHADKSRYTSTYINKSRQASTEDISLS